MEKREDRRYVSLAWIKPNYFRTPGTPLLAGRDFTFQDQTGRRVAILNERKRAKMHHAHARAVETVTPRRLLPG